jgi:hypothetical protein
MNIGNLELRNWKYYKGLSCWSLDHISDEHVFYSNCIEVGLNNNIQWEVRYGGKLQWLKNIYNGPEYFDMPNEAMDYIDNWIERMNKLKVFW